MCFESFDSLVGLTLSSGKSKAGGGHSAQAFPKFCNIYIRNIPNIPLEDVGGLWRHIGTPLNGFSGCASLCKCVYRAK